MPRYRSIEAVYGKDGLEKIQKSRVLVVGAGGIGCEILKNMALVGFRSVELIDLDTIDVSNLNRQFLFRQEHVGRPKATIAGQAAMQFNPEMHVKSHYGNVKNSEYGISYIKSFNVVLNALDNIDARRHVNRLCLAAGVPLIDSGTTGYLGQVMPIMKDQTACYECFPKPTQKVYPICTIRSTPDKPVHCIVWAKECFKLLFGNSAESMLFEGSDSVGDTSAYMHLVNALPSHALISSVSNTATSSGCAVAPNAQSVATMVDFVKKLTLALFQAETEKRIAMGVYKTAKSEPIPLSSDIVDAAVVTLLGCLGAAQQSEATEGGRSGEASTERQTNKALSPLQQPGADQISLPIESWVVEFMSCICEAMSPSSASISSTGTETSNASAETATAASTAAVSLIGKLTFDKDDAWAMRFVTAASNIRSSVFSIPMLSQYEAKGIAGNIIPAIATTNAIVAGVQVMQAIKLIVADRGNHAKGDEGGSGKHHQGQEATTTTATRAGRESEEGLLDLCPHTYCLRHPTRRGYYLQPSKPEKPVGSCYVCGSSQLILRIDVNSATLFDVVKKVIKGKLGFNEPSIMLGDCFLYEEGDGADEDLADNLPKILSQCPAGGIQEGSILSIEDFSQSLEVKLVVRHESVEDLTRDVDSAAAADEFIIEGQGAFEQRQASLISSSSSSAVAASGNSSSSSGQKPMKYATTTLTSKISSRKTSNNSGSSSGGAIVIEEDDEEDPNARRGFDFSEDPSPQKALRSTVIDAGAADVAVSAAGGNETGKGIGTEVGIGIGGRPALLKRANGIQMSGNPLLQSPLPPDDAIRMTTSSNNNYNGAAKRKREDGDFSAGGRGRDDDEIAKKR